MKEGLNLTQKLNFMKSLESAGLLNEKGIEYLHFLGKIVK